jgi:hypothetical protein
MIENVKGQRGATTKLKAELRRLTARRSLPISHEPLKLIFQYFVHSYGQLPDKLLLVCRTFYVVAINCRSLWTNLNPVGQPTLFDPPHWAGTFIQSRVARSNPAPLDIDFTNVYIAEMEEEFAEKVAAIPTLLQRCRSVVISCSNELVFFQGFQPLLESLTMDVQTLEYDLPDKYPWESVGECPNLRSLKLRTASGRENWPEHLFQQLTQLEIMMPVREGNNRSYHPRILPVATRLQSLTLAVDFGVPRRVTHKSLQTLVLVYRVPHMVEGENTLGEIVCPELRRLEIESQFRTPFPSIQLRHTQKLSDLCLDCIGGVEYDEEALLLNDKSFNEKWTGSIVELLRSIGTVKHLQLKSGVKLASGLVEKIEADPTLCPDLVSLHAEPPPLVWTTRPSKRERTLLLKLEARISKRYQQLRRE